MLTARQWRQLWYLPVLAIAMALMMARLLAAARLLDVPAFAAFSTGLLLSTTFCMLGCVGLQFLLQRDMPLLLARRRERAALVLLAQALLVALACAAAVLLPAMLASGRAGVSPQLAAAGVLHGLSQQAFLVATVDSRSRGEALRYAVQNLWRALLVVGAGTGVAAASGSAVLVLLAEGALSLVLVGRILLRLQARTQWPIARLATLALRSWHRVSWRTAGVMLAISGVGFALVNLDRWLAVRWLAPAAFAQFSFAAIVLLAAQSVQSMVNASVYPMIARRFGLLGAPAAFRLACGMSLASLAAGVLLAWPAELVAQAAIRRWFPVYQPAIGLLWPLLAAGVLRVSDYWSSYLMVCNHERHLLRIQASACVAAAGGWLLLQNAGGAFAPEPLDFCWLSLLLAAASQIASAASAWLRRPDALSEGRSTHAPPQ